MKRIQSLVLLSALVIPAAGCAANPLVGDWQVTGGSTGFTFTGTLHLRADGTAGATLTGTGSCTGSQNFEGARWSSTDSTITYSGTSACTGMVTCTIGTMSADLTCDQTSMQMSMTGACQYVLSNNNNTLTVSGCSNSSGAQSYTRAGSGS